MTPTIQNWEKNIRAKYLLPLQGSLINKGDDKVLAGDEIVEDIKILLSRQKEEMEVKEIYILEKYEQWVDDVAYFTDLTKAREELAKRVVARKKELREEDMLAKGNDVPDGKFNGKVEPKSDKNHPNVLYQADIYFWEKVSYEYDEWDVTGEVWRIRKVPILAALKESREEKPRKTSWGPGGKCTRCDSPVEVICRCETDQFRQPDPTS